MRELDHHPEPVSLHDCAVCQDSGIEVESREYCQACYRGKRRKNVDSFAEKLRGLPFTDAMWIVAHSTINTERAIAAAELALLKSKLRQAERELAEVRKDAERYRHLRDAETLNQTIWDALDGFGSDEPEGYRRGFDMAVDAAIDAASVAQANKEQGNG
jgi:hypothetical protein